MVNRRLNLEWNAARHLFALMAKTPELVLAGVECKTINTIDQVGMIYENCYRDVVLFDLREHPQPAVAAEVLGTSRIAQTAMVPSWNTSLKVKQVQRYKLDELIAALADTRSGGTTDPRSGEAFDPTILMALRERYAILIKAYQGHLRWLTGMAIPETPRVHFT